ncbi:MAG TPA: class I SAM-dependent methyltransferase [Acidimicrobiales bacterium]|nr:class I SAM-dependent methyltransferase [Acidimicrobiales bacterium]
MNANHEKVCPTPEWAEWLQTKVLPPLVDAVDIGGEMIEIGPGPGAATAWLCGRVKRLVAVEVDQEAAAKLEARYAGTNVEILVADATALEFEDESFDSAACFTMLHHVPTVAMQNKVLSEILRLLRPGGVLIASDSLASDGLHHFHEGDVYNPIEPASLIARLQTIGFGKMTVSVDYNLTFTAHKPAPGDDSCGRDDS